MPRPRWFLSLQARVMRFLMSIGLFIHKLASPRPPSPAFNRLVQSTLSSNPGAFLISVYTPPGYEQHRRRRFESVRSGAGYPCIINYHGGGFTLGTATDDARFIRTAISKLDCVVISVNYRLAPEHPFPTAVDDGADAVLWAADNAEELGIDPTSLTLSGFSSGGNLTLSVPIRLHDHLHSIDRPLYTTSSPPLPRTSSLHISPLDPSSSTLSLPESIPLKSASPFRPSDDPSPISHKFNIKALCPFYPSTNYALPRSVRRATNPNPAVDLPHGLTRLFDESYIYPAHSVRLDHPYLSPGLLSNGDMRDVYAGMRVLGIGCEFDMLCREGGDAMATIAQARGARARTTEGETVVGFDEEGVGWRVVRAVPHGWDKRPFLSAEVSERIEREYDWVCEGLKGVLDGNGKAVAGASTGPL
ncbi:Hormone-sensitive lipase [Sphaceloma murrayae]|uniref:Hormone-sensitive lipase n=1 Tax=Sphaceloma murrayae TaxID=2082308 RepID=A0A2K1QKU0_9PEZI|nr:Hormone-sensitive lipase [Sphaceloma murrayae]